MRTSFKYFYIYLFLIIFVFIGLGCGFLYFNNNEVGEEIRSSIDIKEILNNNSSPIVNDIKLSMIIFLSTFLVIFLPFMFFKLFFFSFSLGYLFHLLLGYGLLFDILFCLVYFIVPLLLLLLLCRVGCSITKSIVLLLFKQTKIHTLKIYIRQYFVIFIILLIYDFLLFIFSGLFNTFLLSMMN